MTVAKDKLQPQIDLFPTCELLPGLVICESIKGDPYQWGNATTDCPPFIAYIGYNTPSERDGYICQLRQIWKIQSEITYRAAQRVKGYWHEIKVHGMQRYSDPAVFDLDYLSESKDYGLDYLQYLIEIRLEEEDYEAMTTSRIITQC